MLVDIVLTAQDFLMNASDFGHLARIQVSPKEWKGYRQCESTLTLLEWLEAIIVHERINLSGCRREVGLPMPCDGKYGPDAVLAAMSLAFESASTMVAAKTQSEYRYDRPPNRDFNTLNSHLLEMLSFYGLSSKAKQDDKINNVKITSGVITAARFLRECLANGEPYGNVRDAGRACKKRFGTGSKDTISKAIRAFPELQAALSRTLELKTYGEVRASVSGNSEFDRADLETLLREHAEKLRKQGESEVMIQEGLSQFAAMEESEVRRILAIA